MDYEFKIFIGDQKFEIGYPLVIITLCPPSPPLNARISERFLILINLQKVSENSRAFRNIYHVPDSIISNDMIYEEQLINCSVWLDELLGKYFIKKDLPSIYPNWGKLTEVDSTYLLSLILSNKIDEGLLNHIQKHSRCFKLADYIGNHLHDRRLGIKTEEIEFD